MGIESMLEVDNPAGVVLMLGLVTPQKKRSEGQDVNDKHVSFIVNDRSYIYKWYIVQQ